MRRQLWKNIEEVYRRVKRTWTIMGDFNNVLYVEERIGRPIDP